MNPSQNKKSSEQKKNVNPDLSPSAAAAHQRNDDTKQDNPPKGISVPVGGRDIDPFVQPDGGGMLYDPMRAERSRDPRTDIDYIGNPQRLPSGSVPPGARFDPFGPPDLRQQQPNRSPNKLPLQTDPTTKAYHGREPDPNIEPMPDDDDHP
jgi:hypothetical protein